MAMGMGGSTGAGAGRWAANDFTSWIKTVHTLGKNREQGQEQKQEQGQQEGE